MQPTNRKVTYTKVTNIRGGAILDVVHQKACQLSFWFDFQPETKAGFRLLPTYVVLSFCHGIMQVKPHGMFGWEV